jgi:hypothetical protein
MKNKSIAILMPKDKKIKLDLSKIGAPHITTHLENGEMVEGEGLKKRGRPKKANNVKLLKDLGKRLSSQKKMEEKKQKMEEAKEKKLQRLKKEVPTIPPLYKPSTEPTIKVDLSSKPKREKAKTHNFEEPLEWDEPAFPAKFTTPESGRKRRAGRADADTLKDRGVRTALVPLQNKARQIKAQKQVERQKKALVKLQSLGRQLNAKEEAKRLKLQRELEAEAKETGETDQPTPLLKKEFKSSGKKAPPPPSTPPPEKPEGKLPGQKGFWTGKKPPDYSGKGKHPENYRAWIIDNPLAEESRTFYKSPNGKEFLEQHPEIKSLLPAPKPAGRPKKELPPAPVLPPEQAGNKALKDANKTIAFVKNALIRSAEPKAEAKAEAKEETEAKESKEAKVEEVKKGAEERKKSSKSAVNAFAKALQTGSPIPTGEKKPFIRSVAPLPKKRSSSSVSSSSRSSSSSVPEPPSRVIPVAEDAKATSVLSAEALSALPQHTSKYTFKPNYSGRSNDSVSDESYEPASLEEGEIRGEGLFDKIKWGSLTQQFNEYKKSHPEIKSLEAFAHHILSNPNEFNSRTLKRANFYKNVIEGKGLEEGDSDSDSDSDEEIISHNTIMPMKRPVCLHPALESSTMTMNPGAYNNIKPLMGHLMGGGVGNHIHRLEHNGRTSSHYGEHASHPQMMPTGNYHKHTAMKGGAIHPTLDDLIHHSVQHLSGKFGVSPDQAHHLLHTALHQGADAIPEDLHPLAKLGLTTGLKSLIHTMGGHIGGAFWGDLGKTLGHAFTSVGDQIKDKAERVYHKDIEPKLPELLQEVNKGYNNPGTQGAIAGLSTGLSEFGMPEVGIPLSLANTGISNALDAGANHRDVGQQLNGRYIDKVNEVLRKTGIKGVPQIKGKGVWKDLGKTVANDLGYLANAGSSKLVDMMGNPDTQSHSMKGEGVWDDLGNNVANNLGYLANAGSSKLVNMMGNPDTQSHSMKGGKVWKNLGKTIANDLGYLANAGSSKLVDLMGNPDTHYHSMKGGEVGDGLYAGRGLYAQGNGLGEDIVKKLSGLGNSMMPLLQALKPSYIDSLNEKTGIPDAIGKLGGKGVKKGRPAKGSPEAKEMMAKMRAMRGKKVKGGALPPPSRSPITDPTLNGGGLYA